MTNNPTRQHYLPRMYLKNFCNSSGKVWVYNDKNLQIKELSIKDTTLINDFYTIEGEDGGKSYVIEKDLSIIENACTPIFEKIINCSQITMEEKGYLALFIAIMQHRTPSSVDLIHRKIDPVLDFIKKQSINNGVFDEFIKKSETELGLSKEFQLDLLKESNLMLTKNGEWGMLMDSAKHMAQYYAMMKWEFFYTEESTFITTDNPLLIYPAKHDTGPYGNIGIAMPSVEKFFTIAPNVILRIGDLGDTGTYYGKYNHKAIIRHINCSYFVNRERFVISQDKKHLEFLLKRTKNHKSTIEVKIN